MHHIRFEGPIISHHQPLSRRRSVYRGEMRSCPGSIRTAERRSYPASTPTRSRTSHQPNICPNRSSTWLACISDRTWPRSPSIADRACRARVLRGTYRASRALRDMQEVTRASSSCSSRVLFRHLRSLRRSSSRDGRARASDTCGGCSTVELA